MELHKSENTLIFMMSYMCSVCANIDPPVANHMHSTWTTGQNLASNTALVSMVWPGCCGCGSACRVSSRIFFLGGGKIVCKDELCVKHAKFLTSHMPIYEYQSPMHEKHKARVFIIRYCINSQNFWGEVGEFGGGGSFPPPPPPPPSR